MKISSQNTSITSSVLSYVRSETFGLRKERKLKRFVLLQELRCNQNFSIGMITHLAFIEPYGSFAPKGV
jgi:hypothetical protein